MKPSSSKMENRPTLLASVFSRLSRLVNNVIPPQAVDFELTLTVVTGTGAFAGTTGTIHVSIQWLGGMPAPVTGSVTVRRRVSIQWMGWCRPPRHVSSSRFDIS